jgi:hypothetical protein
MLENVCLDKEHIIVFDGKRHFAAQLMGSGLPKFRIQQPSELRSLVFRGQDLNQLIRGCIPGIARRSGAEESRSRRRT